MLRMNLSLFVLTLALGASAAGAQTTTNVQLILDASGSMLTKLPDGQTRIASAKSTLTQFLGGLNADPSLNVGMRIYGGGLKAGAQCEDSVLVTPMKGFDKTALQKQVTDATPKGATPIVYSLMQAANDFPKDSSRKVIVLVTDGEESCGGKLNDAVAAFKKLGIEVDLRIIGIDLNEKALPLEPGEYEIRYSNFNVSPHPTLASTPITLKAATYVVSAATTAQAGNILDVKWTGPNNPKDFITVVKKGTPEGRYAKYEYTKDGNPAKLLLPLEPGEYEIRYSNFDANPKLTLASTAITLKAATYNLSAPASARAGSTIQVKWTGANFPKDFITVVKKGTPEGRYAKYEYTSKGNPLSIKLPDEPGTYELRYTSFNDSAKPTLARTTIEVK